MPNHNNFIQICEKYSNSIKNKALLLPEKERKKFGDRLLELVHKYPVEYLVLTIDEKKYAFLYKIYKESFETLTEILATHSNKIYIFPDLTSSPSIPHRPYSPYISSEPLDIPPIRCPPNSPSSSNSGYICPDCHLIFPTVILKTIDIWNYEIENTYIIFNPQCIRQVAKTLSCPYELLLNEDIRIQIIDQVYESFGGLETNIEDEIEDVYILFEKFIQIVSLEKNERKRERFFYEIRKMLDDFGFLTVKKR